MTDARSVQGRHNCRADTAEECRGKKVGSHCRSCLMKARRADPVAEAQRVANLRAGHTAERRDKRSEAMKASHAKRAGDPAYQAMLQASAVRLQRILMSPEIRAKTYSAEVVARRARKHSNNRMAWCPLEYRDLARSLVVKGVGTSAEVKRMIEHKIEADRRKYLRTGELQASKGERR